MLCRGVLREEDKAPATDLTQRHEVTAETQQFIKQVWPGLSFFLLQENNLSYYMAQVIEKISKCIEVC